MSQGRQFKCYNKNCGNSSGLAMTWQGGDNELLNEDCKNVLSFIFFYYRNLLLDKVLNLMTNK